MKSIYYSPTNNKGVSKKLRPINTNSRLTWVTGIELDPEEESINAVVHLCSTTWLSGEPRTITIVAPKFQISVQWKNLHINLFGIEGKLKNDNIPWKGDTSIIKLELPPQPHPCTSTCKLGRWRTHSYTNISGTPNNNKARKGWNIMICPDHVNIDMDGEATTLWRLYRAF